MGPFHTNPCFCSCFPLFGAGFGLVGGGPNPSEIFGRKREKNGPNGGFFGVGSPNRRAVGGWADIAESLCLCGKNAPARRSGPADRFVGEIVSLSATRWRPGTWKRNRLDLSCFGVRPKLPFAGIAITSLYPLAVPAPRASSRPSHCPKCGHAVRIASQPIRSATIGP